MNFEQDDRQVAEVTAEKLVRRRDFLKMAAAVGGSALALSQLRLDALAEHTPSHGHETCPVCKGQPGKPCPVCKNKPQGTTQNPMHSHETCPVCKGQPGKSCPVCQGMSQGVKQPLPKDHPMRGYNPNETIQAMTFPNLSTVEGISQNQLNQHIELYNGYVKKINEIDSQIRGMQPNPAEVNATYHPYRELHVEQTYALNGVILHEYYFQNIGGAKAAPGEMLKNIITREFGSWDNYVNHLLAVGKGMRGWAITGYNMRDHRVHNYGLDLHNQWVPVNVIPLLVLDVYEHAYMIDFGTKRAAYLDAFLRNVNWQVVEDRLKTMIFHG